MNARIAGVALYSLLIHKRWSYLFMAFSGTGTRIAVCLHTKEQDGILVEEARIQRDSRPVGKIRFGAIGRVGDNSLGAERNCE